MSETNERQYWLWVTRQEYYRDEDGNDREDLDPGSGVDSDGWWTCHRDTKRGDLVLLWRTMPKSDLGYLIQAESDAYSIVEENIPGWDYGCDYQVLYKFENPVTVKDLRNSPYFEDWGPLRCSFQHSNFRINPEYWAKLNELIVAKNNGYVTFLENIQKEPIAKVIVKEEDFEKALVNNLGVLNKFGYNLELYTDPTTGLSGQQFICGYGGRIDLLCHDKSRGRYVVIELKIVRAGQNTFGQISGYMGWVQDRIARNEPVLGLVISRGYDTKFEAALKTTNRIFPLHVDDLEEDLGFSKGYLDPKIPPRPPGIKPLISPSPKSKGDSWLRKGDIHLRQGRYAEAIDAYEKAIELDPRYAKAWNNKGLALDSLNKLDESVQAFEKAVEINPRYVEAWYNKGTVLDDQGKYDEAIKAYNKAVELKPNYVAALNSKGFALWEFGRYDEAIKEYDKAIEIKQKSVDAWCGKGLVFDAMKKYEEAIQCYDKATKFNPKNTTSWISKGYALNEQGKFDEAIKAFEKAIKLDPNFAGGWVGKGVTLHHQERCDEAIKAFEKAIELEPNGAGGWVGKGISLKSQGKYDEAIQALDYAIQLEPDYANAYNNKGIALKALGRDTEANAAFDKAKELGHTG
jgi:tetratricopeptide (TPR) repeat protein